MQLWRIEIKNKRSVALDRLAGVEKTQKLRNALIQTIIDQKSGDIRIVFASLDWIYRYYHHMNKICKTGLDDFLDLNLE
jgi:hypothetical protein